MEATIRTLRGNEALALDDPDALWIVERGSIALFTVDSDDAASGRSRRYCFSCASGDLVCGLPRAGAGAPGLVAVALEDSALRRVAASEREAAPAPECVRRWIGSWNARLGSANGEVPIEDAAAALARFHAELLPRLRECEARETAEERERGRERERRAREAARRAVAELSSLLLPEAPPPAEGSPLFVAAAAVARTLGSTLRAPAPWEGASAAAEPVEAIAGASHLRARRVVLPESWWREECGALLGFLDEQARPVALLPRGRRYEMLDPVTRERVVIDSALAARIRPEAWTFYRPLPEGTTRALDLLRFALRGRGRDLGWTFAAGVAASLVGMAAPIATGLIFDHAIPDGNRSLLLQLGGGLLAAALGAAGFRLAQGIALVRLETAADGVAQAAMWDRLLKLRLAFFRDYTTGDLASRVSAVGRIRAQLSGTTLRAWFGAVVLVLYLGLLLYYSPALTVVALVSALASAAIAIGSGALIVRGQRRALERSGRLAGLMVQLIHGVAKLRVAAAEERAFARWGRDYAELLRIDIGQRRIADTVQLVNLAVATLSVVALFAVATTVETMSTGRFLAFLVAYGTFIGAVVALSNTVTTLLSVSVLRERARPILEASPEVDERKSDPGRLSGALRIEGLSFRYRDDGPPVLDKVTLDIAPESFVAFVGPSGSGKSTLFRLLLGFEAPQAGAIVYDGQDLTSLDVHAVRRQMGVVLQQGRINAGSLFDNVTGGTRASLAEAWAAVRAAGFAEDVEAMPMGLHTIVSEGGTNLSGGQRQRLLLARALVHRPRILLLDEATSALDNRTQAVVGESLRRLSVTRLVIAHRLSTVRHADAIHVIEGGRVVESGNFDELSARGGLFAQLMARQRA